MKLLAQDLADKIIKHIDSYIEDMSKEKPILPILGSSTTIKTNICETYIRAPLASTRKYDPYTMCISTIVVNTHCRGSGFCTALLDILEDKYPIIKVENVFNEKLRRMLVKRGYVEYDNSYEEHGYGSLYSKPRPH